MNTTILRKIATGWCATLVLTACPGDESTATGTADSTTTGTSDEESMTDPETMTAPESMTDPDTSAGPTTTTDATTTDATTTDATTTDATTTDATTTDATTTDATTTDATTTDATTTDATTTDATTTDATTTGATTTGGTTTGGAGCPDEDLGTELPASTIGSTVGALDEQAGGSCGAGDSEDYVVSWTAPSAGTFRVSTSNPGTDFDTVLYALDSDCDGAELVCDDEGGTLGNSSRFDIVLAADQTIAIVIDGWNGSAGAFELTITEVPEASDGASCCVDDSAAPGCDNSLVEACVCAIDDFCCDTEWDAACVNIAQDSCNAICPIPNCIEDAACAAPDDDCVCQPCIDDDACTFEEDCVCNDCDADAFCATACNDDAICDPYNEGCACADCSDEPVCALPESEALVAGPGLAVAVPDDAYNGALGTMACVVLPLAANGVDNVTGGQLQLGMAHTWVGDMVIKVVSPLGTVVTVLSRPGFVELADDGTTINGDSSNLLATSPITYVNGGLTDAETLGAVLGSGGVVCQDNALCVYDPNPGAAVPGDFSAFAGESAVGDWQVCVGDSAIGDLGTIDAITLTIDQN